ncbi:hypothetical protein TSUD_239160 [Trifolium subterraneum]|uniref:Uncharacterized protein n=1 Tax=Trifolium subterraneum TaxID=3900 RepID=A0A2Z6NZQ7_TRISU|nr:hypothetical protein TSUD_239160 [Trifolium subterraneum]
MIVDYLSDTDNIYQPVARAFANFIASKISPLADVEIARLTNNEISKLIHRLPEAEIRRLIDDEISRLSDLFTTLGQDIYREFSSGLTMCLWSVLGILTFMNVVLFISLAVSEAEQHS